MTRRRVVIARFDIELITFLVDPDRESNPGIAAENGGGVIHQRDVIDYESGLATESPPAPPRAANSLPAHNDIPLQLVMPGVQSSTADEVPAIRASLHLEAIVRR